MKPHIFKFWSLYFTGIVSPTSSYIFYFTYLKYYSEKGTLTQEKVTDLELISILITKEQPKANTGRRIVIPNLELQHASIQHSTNNGTTNTSWLLWIGSQLTPRMRWKRKVTTRHLCSHQNVPNQGPEGPTASFQWFRLRRLCSSNAFCPLPSSLLLSPQGCSVPGWPAVSP